jgi:tetratricopeptide (TPR) repeat protein
VDIKTSDKYVEDGAVKSVIVMADEAAREIAYELTDYFAPRFEKLSFPIENIKLKEFKDRSKEGRDYLIRGELGKGFQIFKAIYDADSYNPKAAYNVGTVYEVVGDFENAYACYSVAHELEADDTDFFKAFQRAEKGKLLVTDLKAIGIEIKPRMFQNGTSDVLLSKVETKGGKSDRVQIYEEPNDKSVVIAKIPGGIKLAVVQKAEGWYLVKILGGKEGYVRENEVSEE